MLRCLDGAERFQAVLGTRPCSRSAHFMLHYRAVDKLSTALTTPSVVAVDETEATSPGRASGQAAGDVSGPAPEPAAARVHLGLVVPKRHAKRAVTRNLVRREARAQMTRCADRLPPGDWVLRLRAPFDRQTFSSAASAALLSVVREEMTRLIADGLRAAGKATARVDGSAR
jgi:ribonuclease P protein component